MHYIYNLFIHLFIHSIITSIVHVFFLNLILFNSYYGYFYSTHAITHLWNRVFRCCRYKGKERPVVLNVCIIMIALKTVPHSVLGIFI